MPQDQNKNSIINMVFHDTQGNNIELPIIKLDGKEEYSKLWHYKILILVPNKHQGLCQLGQNAIIKFFDNSSNKSIQNSRYGIISKVEKQLFSKDFNQFDQSKLYQLELSHELEQLNYNIQSQIYQRETLLSIFNQIFKKYDIDPFIISNGTILDDISIDLLTQYQESDFNFFQRQLEIYGIVYHFSAKNGQNIIFNKEISHSVTDENIYAPPSHHGQQIENAPILENLKFIEQRNKIDNCDYTILANLQNRHSSWTDLTNLSKAYTHFRLICPGMEYEIELEVNQNHLKYICLVSEISYSRQNSILGVFKDSEFRCKIHSIDSEKKNLTIPQFAIKPQAPLFLKAHISPKSILENSNLDDKGNYIANIPISSAENQHSSSTTIKKRLKLVQPAIGNQAGLHFPMTPGAQVYLGFENNNIDLPFILGGVPNDDNPSPVNRLNANQHILKSKSGHQLIMTDSKLLGKLQLKSAGGNKLTMNDMEARQKISLKSGPGAGITLNQIGTIKLKSLPLKSVIIIKPNQIEIKINKKHIIQINKKTIELKNDKHNITLDYLKGIKLESEENITLDSKKKISLNAERIELKAPKIRAQATKRFRVKSKKISLESTQKSLHQAKKLYELSAMTAKVKTKVSLKLITNGTLKTQAACSQIISKGITKIKAALIFLN